LGVPTHPSTPDPAAGVLPRLLAGAALLLPGAAPLAQPPDRPAVTVRLDGRPGAALTPRALGALPPAAASAPGQSHRYTGVPLSALLAHAGAWPAGDPAARTTGARGDLRGAALARYVVVTGADGYRAPLALAELDSATAAPAPGGPVILADSVDGPPLPAAEGPYRLVVPGDRRPARSVRQVVAIAVGSAP
jgi:DMSO/TMAO reductase YedYZ molybdopterin-dependent catalytic subunit